MNNRRKYVLKFFNNTNNYLHKTFGLKVRKKIVYDLLGNLHDKEILDVGCGNGVISLEYAKKNNLTMIDISAKMLELAREKAELLHINNINYIESSIEKFDSKKKYDVIIAVGLLSHVTSIHSTIVQLNSLLQKNGNLIIQFSDYNSIITKINILFSRRNYVVNKSTKENMSKIIRSLEYSLKNEVKYSILLPGMGRLSDKILYHITMLTYQNPYVSNYGTDFIWNLKKK